MCPVGTGSAGDRLAVLVRRGRLALGDFEDHIQDIGVLVFVDPIIHLFAALLANEQSGVAQYLEVVGNGGTTEMKDSSNVGYANLLVGIKQ
jgi:hypothetical protein